MAGGWDRVAVHVLVEGCGTGVGGVKDSLAGGREHLGVENQVGVSFISAEAATEAMVVSMDSSSMSSMSNESTRETSLVASATILKETSLMGVGNLAFASAYCTTKTALQLPVSLTVQQYLWASDFILRMLFVDLS